ncbi:MAG: YihA family ribosome biogenesis GTP-binding protein, partial [Pseudomonadota bacterium]
DRAAVTFQAVLTKADKLKPRDRDRAVEGLGRALTAHPAAYPEVIVTSSESGEGIPDLRTVIHGLMS